MLYHHHPYKYNQCHDDTIILLIYQVCIMAAICVGMVVTTHVFYVQHKGKVSYLNFNIKVVATVNQVRIFDDVRLEEHHKDLLLYDSNNRLVTTGHLGRLLSDSIHP